MDTSTGLSEHQLILGNMWIVHWVISSNDILDYDDMIQCGYLGLINAVRNRNWKYHYNQWVDFVKLKIRDEIRKLKTNEGYNEKRCKRKYDMRVNTTHNDEILLGVPLTDDLFDRIDIDQSIQSILETREYNLYRLLIEGYSMVDITDMVNLSIYQLQKMKKKIFEKIEKNLISETLND